jgi:hypothetical protein
VSLKAEPASEQREAAGVDLIADYARRSRARPHRQAAGSGRRLEHGVGGLWARQSGRDEGERGRREELLKLGLLSRAVGLSRELRRERAKRDERIR